MIKYTFYTDGACSGNGRAGSRGGWAWVIATSSRDIDIPHVYNTTPVEGTTNNTMELTAVVEALRYVESRHYDEEVHVEIKTDSQLVIGWLSLNWRRNQSHLTALLTEADRLLCKYIVTFTKVKGHSGDPFNELADRLAVRGCALN